MKMNRLSLFLVLSSVVSGGVFYALKENNNARLGVEDTSVKGADTSFSVDYGKQARRSTISDSTPPPPSPGSPPSKSIKQFALDEESMEQGFASGVFEKTTEKGEEAIGQVVGKTKEGFYHVKGGGKMRTQKVKENADLVMDQTKEAFGKAKDNVKDVICEKVPNLEGSLASKAKEAWGNTKEELEKAKEIFAEKVPGAEKTMENIKNIGLDTQKVHNSLWDDRSITTKVNELFMNVTYTSKRGGEITYHATSEKIMKPPMVVFHLLFLSIAYGMHVWVCFVSSNVLARTLPWQQYLTVQSKICSIYFRTMVGIIGCSLLAYCLRSPHGGLKSSQVYVMLVSLCLIIFNRFCSKTRVTKLLFDKMKLEKEEGRRRWKNENLIDPMAEHQGFHASITLTTSLVADPSTRTAGEVTSQLEQHETSQLEQHETQLWELERRLKNLKALSSIIDVATLLALTTLVVCAGKSLSQLC